ncbi:uncharacterized protein EV420DRAFT_1643853 [Desarmillaria tabescens]|uniref:Uncharacterized protein n=1 Tax=Armillaria tabescens TaxID=1929756 RepID=A0AA39N4W1_ARMTA|nr:uncharacterized protein EV420DRAFT_1643853 [Desarmillaria tabescens]KAK0457519.1 hypothetical protein EV420DRAFT_1643853 [Desarmillaria tabescens]
MTEDSRRKRLDLWLLQIVKATRQLWRGRMLQRLDKSHTSSFHCALSASPPYRIVYRLISLLFTAQSAAAQNLLPYDDIDVTSS